MGRVFVAAVTVLCLLLASCSSDEDTTGGEELPPPAQPAPTVAGEVVVPEIAEPEFAAEQVLLGLSDAGTEVRVLPGRDQPLAGEIAAGASYDLTGEAFETDDGITWWQVRAGTLQGWVERQVAFLGQGKEITATEAVQSALGDGPYETPDELADLVVGSVASAESAPATAFVSKTEIAGRYSATITVDLVGYDDDSVVGSRLIVAATGRGPDGVDVWRLTSVTQFPLCSRGVSATGLCL